MTHAISSYSDITHTLLDRVDAIAAKEWNAIVGTDCPFLRHEFLQAIETGHSIEKDSGWCTQHLVFHKNDELIGVLPGYTKTHSWGEFVFDFVWADAYHRYGFPYYPKYISAIPYTPATTPKLLHSPAISRSNYVSLLKSTLAELTTTKKLSGTHLLFIPNNDLMETRDDVWFVRTGCQFQWEHRGESNFEEFLALLKPKKRKNIRQERNKAIATGYTFEWKSGEQIQHEDWQAFHQLYCKTNAEHGNVPFFTLATLKAWGSTLGEQVLMCIASSAQGMEAAALCFRSSNTLYGRHWGAREFSDGLHFETCYYQGIEYCIENGLTRFEPGAQGEHKIARGFLPTLTYSLHYLSETPLLTAVKRHAEEEQKHILSYRDQMMHHSPYRA